MLPVPVKHWTEIFWKEFSLVWICINTTSSQSIVLFTYSTELWYSLQKSDFKIIFFEIWHSANSLLWVEIHTFDENDFGINQASNVGIFNPGNQEIA